MDTTIYSLGYFITLTSRALAVHTRAKGCVNDTVLEDELRRNVSTRLLERRARVWWESLKRHSRTASTWLEFQEEFDKEYYTHFHKDQKR